MLQEVYGKVAMKETQVYINVFWDGHTSVTDDLHCRCPATSTSDKNIVHVRNVVQSDRQKRIQKISAELGTSVGNIHSILHKDVNMHYLCHHLMPKILA
jgi:hypothetical protein